MGGGVYIAAKQNLGVTHIFQNSVGPNGELSQTDSGQNVNVRVFGGTDKVNSVGPMCRG